MQDVKIRSWLSGKTLLVTGATGFLGKALIEKLLWDCSEVDKIYLLIRAKDEAHLQERLCDYKKNSAFERIRQSRIELLNKLHPIRGDLRAVKLGLSEEDKNTLIEETNVIFHGGASVLFNETIKDAVSLNTKGTLQMIQFAKSMKNLQSFVYISTAYSNCNYKEIQEKVYPPLYDPEFVINLCDQDKLDSIASEVLKIYPNTYIFSKNIAEQIVYNAREELPVAIARPSIIGASVKDPCPGWLATKHGIVGIMLGGGSGLVRTGYGNMCSLVDIIPVDYAANGVIAAAVNVGQNKDEKCPVYNLATGADCPISWQHFWDYTKKFYRKNPYTQSIWYPGGRMYNCYYAFLISYIFLQFIPAVFFDAILYLIKQKFFFVKIQLKIYANLLLLSHFCINTWRWQPTNGRKLYNQLAVSERNIFNFRADNLDFRKYIRDWNKGVRKFVYGKNEIASKSEIRTTTILYYLDRAVKIALLIYIGYWVSSYFRFTKNITLPSFRF